MLRISLILAIVAGLAVAVLNFVMVKEKITTLQTNLKTETEAHRKFENDFRVTKSNLDKTNAILKQTEATLAATTEEKEKALTDLAAQTKRADKLTEDLTKTREERDAAQADLAAYKATGFKPPEIVNMGKQFKSLQDTITGMDAENKLLGQKLKKTENELGYYKTPETYIVPLPSGLEGKVLVTDPKWNFVVLNVGEDQGVLEHGELLINRKGKLVAKVVVRSVQKDRCIANVVPGWALGEIFEGDQVVPAHPASS